MVFLFIMCIIPLLLRVVDFAVNRTGAQQVVVPADCCDLAVIQYNDLVGVLHGGDALCNDDFRRIGDIFCKSLLNCGIGSGIDCTG